MFFKHRFTLGVAATSISVLQMVYFHLASHRLSCSNSHLKTVYVGTATRSFVPASNIDIGESNDKGNPPIKHNLTLPNPTYCLLPTAYNLLPTTYHLQLTSYHL